MGKEPMDWDAVDRIGAAADRDSSSATAVSGFAARAEAAADRNDDNYDDEDDWGPEPA